MMRILTIIILLMSALNIFSFTAAHGGHKKGLKHHCIHDHPVLRRSLYSPRNLAKSNSEPIDKSNRPSVGFLELGKVRLASGHEGPSETLTVPTIKITKNDILQVSAKDRTFQGNAMKPLRIVFRTPNLFDNTSYCTKATGTVPDFVEGNISCSTDMIFTDQKRNLLINKVLPEASRIFSRYLSLRPTSAAIQVPQGICGSQNTIPIADQTDGVEDADFIVYVSAAPITSGTIAFAGMCAVDSTTYRPLVAKANFAPMYLEDESNLEAVFNIAVHELTHALGFSQPFIDSQGFAFAGAITQSTRRGGQPVWLYVGPTALLAARNHFSCPTLDGIEMEDEGGSGTAYSHWERRTHRDDLMAGIVGDVMALSEMTFGLLQDSGHYTLNRSTVGAATVSKGYSTNGLVNNPAPNAPFETAKYMYQFGCGAFYNKCHTLEGGAGTYFCFDQDISVRHCERDYSAIGYCNVQRYSGSLPTWAQYFADPTLGGFEQLYDYCPYVNGFSNRQCNDYNNTYPNNTIQGLYFARDGRCFVTSAGLIDANYSYPGTSNPGGARCFQARCPSGNRVQFRVGKSDWVDCPLDGSVRVVAAPSGYTGNVTCPLASDFCTDDLFYDEPATTSSPVASPTTTSTSTTLTSTSTVPTSTSTTLTSTSTTPTSTSTPSTSTSTTLTSTSQPSSTLDVTSTVNVTPTSSLMPDPTNNNNGGGGNNINPNRGNSSGGASSGDASSPLDDVHSASTSIIVGVVVGVVLGAIVVGAVVMLRMRKANNEGQDYGDYNQTYYSSGNKEESLAGASTLPIEAPSYKILVDPAAHGQYTNASLVDDRSACKEAEMTSMVAVQQEAGDSSTDRN